MINKWLNINTILAYIIKQEDEFVSFKDICIQNDITLDELQEIFFEIYKSELKNELIFDFSCEYEEFFEGESEQVIYFIDWENISKRYITYRNNNKIAEDFSWSEIDWNNEDIEKIGKTIPFDELNKEEKYMDNIEYMYYENEEDWIIDELCILQSIDSIENIKVKILCNNSNLLEMYTKLTTNEEFVLYTFLMECEEESIKDIANNITMKLHHKYKDKYEKLKDKVLIKNITLPFSNYSKLLWNLYNVINNKEDINIITSREIITRCTPTRVFYDYETLGWKLEYIKKKGHQSIRLENICDIDVLEEKIKRRKVKPSLEGIWGNGVPTSVKFRIYHENGAKEKALRYILKKEVEIETKEEYTDFTIMVEDDNLFLRWIRGLTPNAVILSPKELKERMEDEIRNWQSVYEKI